MKILKIIKIAWKAILLNKTRTLLTILGIIIGVSSVITMMSVGQGSKESIRSQISSMGSNMIIARPGAESRGGIMMGASEIKSLTLSDFKKIQEQASLLTSVSPLVNSAGQSVYGSNNWPTTIYGATPEYISIRQIKMKDGSMFTMAHVKSSAKVAVIGKTIVDNLFTNGENPIGKTIRFKKIPFKVIGVLEAKGESTFGQDQDDIIIAPYTAVQKRIVGDHYLQSIMGSVASEEQAAAAVDQVTSILRKAHAITDDDDNDFNVMSMQELINTISSTSDMLSLLLIAIASISLIVGGIGIMNIMYVSVKERTREIGLRLAVGAKGSAILMQFLIEAVILSFFGGLIGIIFGLAATQLIKNYMHWPTVITSSSIIVSFAVCAITGIFFGWYPAKKASSLDPLEALRYE